MTRGRSRSSVDLPAPFAPTSPVRPTPAASHDVPFLRELGLTRWLRLDGGLEETDPQ